MIPFFILMKEDKSINVALMCFSRFWTSVENQWQRETTNPPQNILVSVLVLLLLVFFMEFVDID